MADSTENDFLAQLSTMVENNISNEQFGVTELAHAMNMSRSNLLRKVKKETSFSVNQLIRDVRLKRAMQLLQKNTLNVSEVAFQVGFSSTSYFIKCFREYYGYPPGEVGKRPIEEVVSKLLPPPKKISKSILFSAGAVITIAVIGLLYYYRPFFGRTLDRSIAVLPFKNESSDSSNVYFINGLMEATLSNLQKIEALRVISRTSSEKYRYLQKSVPEMAKELNVNYVVEGSGQKIGNEILLNIQLIEARSDKHLWAKQYRRKAEDIFKLQQEVAKNIAQEIEAIITPEEQHRIEKIPTENLEAYDYYLKGREFLYKATGGDLSQAVVFFTKAIELDHRFAAAYANRAIAYYFTDVYQIEKKHVTDLSYNADQAELYDAKLDESLIAKGLAYLIKKEYERAVPYFEKALEYNPNSSLTIHFLSEIYNLYAPNTAKYLECALIGLRLNIEADSAERGYHYMHLANALIQTGFIDEALDYINQSLKYNPKNPFAIWIRAGILYAKNRDADETRQILSKAVREDSSRFYLIPEIGKMYYLQRDYKKAYPFYKKFMDISEAQKLDIFASPSLTMAVVLDKLGQKEKSIKYVQAFKDFTNNDKSIYRNFSWAMYYAWTHDNQKALAYLKLFSKEDNIQYWVLLLRGDPLVDDLKKTPEFKAIFGDIETRFWKNHQQLKETLEEKGLLEQ